MAKNDWDSFISGALNRRRQEARDAARTLDGMQAQMEAMLEKQGRQLEAMNRELKARQAVEDAGKLTREMERDGLLRSSDKGSWKGLDAILNQQLLGQEAFTKALVLAFRRPTVMNLDPGRCKNIMVITGAPGSGRHTALNLLAAQLEKRGLLKSREIASLDLSLYPGPAQEKAFLQDLFNALNAPGEIVAFDHYEACAPGYLQMIADLSQDGNLPLAGRYLEQRGILVDVGSALAPGAISALSAREKYFVFFTTSGLEKMAEKLGASFIDLVGDVCATQDYTSQVLGAIAGRQLNELAQLAREKLSFELSATAASRDWLAGQYNPADGVQAIVDWGDKIYKALAQYKLEEDPLSSLAVKLDSSQGQLTLAFGGQPPMGLAALLPAGYTGERAAAQAALDAIIGLEPVKEYVRSLADNVQAQQRRKAAGLPAAAVTMHTIFAGNPGTGKTTIARIMGKYLKAIGALRGGQLIEVSRADLVGRYVGHTAPLTNQVIQSALGGVLFIDEAYSLYRGSDDSFGLEAIDTLVKGMEDHRDDLVVILAGYSREMEVFLTANSGLASRFPNQIEFPDYTGPQLMEIMKSQAKAKGYTLDPGCDAPVTAALTRHQAQDAAGAGNGRLARNMLEAAILNQAKRLAADPAAPLDLLLIQDFNLE